jgi:hypothetical protein
MAADLRYDAKIIKYLDQKRGRAYQLGPDLVTNGTFTTDTAGWTAANVSMAVDAGRLKLTATSTTDLYASQTLITVVGKTYLVSASMLAPGTNTGVNTARVLITPPPAQANEIEVSSEGVTQTKMFIFVATATSTIVRPGVATWAAWGSSGDVAYFDDISVREILL